MSSSSRADSPGSRPRGDWSSPPVGRRGRDLGPAWDAHAPAPAGPAFRLGEDVVHPTFGDGVVTGLEPGGIVVIHFSRDGSERKLVADLAPISKR